MAQCISMSPDFEVNLIRSERSYPRQSTACWVPCEVEIVRGAFHGFDAITPDAPISFAFLAKQCLALRAAFGAPF